MGFPTANLEPEPGLLAPPPGVYLTRAALDGATFSAVTNVGLRAPDPGAVGMAAAAGLAVAETHLLDFDGDLYGRELRVEFFRRIRPVRRFASWTDLRRAIDGDVRAARAAHETLDGDFLRAHD
jgi:riboflavin kinase/FMN adenylyltransferase